jgi:hypothetical protein
MLEDIASEDRRGVAWVRISCDAPRCTASIEARPQVGTWREGWMQDSRSTPATTGAVKD